MITILALILTIGVMIGLELGLFRLCGNTIVAMNSWTLTILGGVFLFPEFQCLNIVKTPPFSRE